MVLLVELVFELCIGPVSYRNLLRGSGLFEHYGIGPRICRALLCACSGFPGLSYDAVVA